MNKIVLVGFGGHAASVADTIMSSGDYEIAGYTDVSDRGESCGIHCLGDDTRLGEIYEKGVEHAFICVGYMGKGKVRDGLYGIVTQLGYDVPVIVDPSAVVSYGVSIGEGTYVGKKAVLNTGVNVGRLCIVNTGANIDHGCHIGDYTHVSVGVNICGDVSIGEHCLIGAGATVIQGTTIGSDVTVGAGSTVLSDIPDGATVYGVCR